MVSREAPFGSEVTTSVVWSCARVRVPPAVKATLQRAIAAAARKGVLLICLLLSSGRQNGRRRRACADVRGQTSALHRRRRPPSDSIRRLAQAKNAAADITSRIASGLRRHVGGCFRKSGRMSFWSGDGSIRRGHRSLLSTPSRSPLSAMIAIRMRRRRSSSVYASPSFCARPMRCSLPVAPLGISARNRIFRGVLNAARRWDTKA